MTNPDEMERLARAAYHDYALADIAVGGGMKATVSVPAFISAASPATVLALLSANREMREILSRLVSLPMAEREFTYLDKGIGTKTPNAVWLEARSALLTTQVREG